MAATARTAPTTAPGVPCLDLVVFWIRVSVFVLLASQCFLSVNVMNFFVKLPFFLSDIVRPRSVWESIYL